MCTPLHGPVQLANHKGVRLVWHMFSPKIALPLLGSSPSNTLFLGPSPRVIPNGILIVSIIFVWVPNAMLYCVLSVGKKTPRIAPFPLGFCHLSGGGPSHSHRQHAQKLIKIARVVSGISSRRDRHTDTHRRTHHNTSQPLPNCMRVCCIIFDYD